MERPKLPEPPESEIALWAKPKPMPEPANPFGPTAVTFLMQRGTIGPLFRLTLGWAALAGLVQALRMLRPGG